nr:YfhO family protein [uncultured Acetatifactor sp.]
MVLQKGKYYFTEWKERHLIVYVLIFLAYFSLACIANWSLLIGENIMKWDIWQAEYSNQVLMTDALSNGTLPIWNPLFQYGSPYYAMLGTPVLYPITLILALIGYTPITLAFSYVIHVAIGGFGMFLLGQQEIKKAGEKWNSNTFFASFIVGLIYCSSGLFLSNAEHIMIIISASWIPYVFFFMRKYSEERITVYAMLSGASAGMILLGGYPELFYDTFLFLVPYTLYFNYDKTKKIFKNIINTLKRYIVVCFFTICSSAISLIPFLHIVGLLTRTNGTAPFPETYSMNALLSLFFPGVSKFANTGEVSMVNYYVSIFIILLIPVLIKKWHKNKFFYGGMLFISYIICIGGNSFVHGVLHRFFPMYSSFRLPSINRCILTMFLLLIAVSVIKHILFTNDIEIILKPTKVFLILTFTLAVVSGLVGNMANDMAGFSTVNMLNFSSSAYILAIILVGYLILFYQIHAKRIHGNLVKILLLGVLIFEMFTFHHVEAPITITAYNNYDYACNSDVQYSIDMEFEKNQNRNRTVDFSNSIRATNGRDSQTIVFNRYLDEDGYLSILLQNVQDYKNTYVHSIMEQNPEAYFTNDTVTSAEVDFNSWVNSGSVPPEQIYIDGEDVDAVNVVRFHPNEIGSDSLTMIPEERGVRVEGNISSGDSKTGRLRLFYDDMTEERKTLNITFTDSNGNISEYNDEFLMQEKEGRFYIDIYMPNIHTAYSSICIQDSDSLPTAADMIHTERMMRDDYVDIISFGFNDIVMEVTAPENGYVVVLQTKYDGWNAYVDGEEAEIVLVDNCFMGIKVAEGQHNIVMQFRPKDFYVGALISGIFYLALIVVSVIYYVRRGINEKLNVTQEI